MKLDFGQKSLTGPVLIPSISSFETQISGSDALKIQVLLQEPVSLISAYDLARDSKMATVIENYRSGGGILFVDSGGYEWSRIKHHLPGDVLKLCEERGATWTKEKHRDAVAKIDYDLGATFDEFMSDDESVDDYKARFVRFLDDQSEFLGSRMVPVVHLKSKTGKKSMCRNEALDFVRTVAKTHVPEYIAIPEREMGTGIRERYELACAICSELRSNTDSTKLHILGCGNPLTFAVLAEAGIAMADGLEWCRTKYGKDYHLHHFQHFDLVGKTESTVVNMALDTFREHARGEMLISLLDNLHAQQDFVEKLRKAIAEQDVPGFLRQHYPLHSDTANWLI